MTYSKSSLIISVYNNTVALKAVLDSIKIQTMQPYEVIVSEDAMHDSIKEFIKQYDFNGNLVHLSQPDDGWQKNIALNKAIKTSSTDYLIFIDGDCVLHPRFVEHHLKYAHPNKILAGKRIKLDGQSSELLLQCAISPSDMNDYIVKTIPY